ncbi:MAG: hypothetical protein A3H70_00640 [Candidatus Komeilibacteria bacterium RIFCSPLOWO2_02_FULL_48_11]|uniref:Uncharacterized protein n=1 Tax=Candidatus Komeilibacteria bacterium RIFCSPLOWO2_02_FULL_48_11 TaxID=1798553 RepID=A0A1G2BTY4_9BACT|nr:MAG: hypothetical protein A3H70_00640 [Candidatus Komeilibacteria bacterium RIFCSPLOWO2_02_FULL_48_11]
MAFDPVKSLEKFIKQRSPKQLLDFQEQVSVFAEFLVEEADRLGLPSHFARKVAEQYFKKAFDRGRRSFAVRYNQRVRWS